jgi:hypothetical protein
VDEPVIDKEDVQRIQFLLIDTLDELRKQTKLMEDDDGEAEADG